MSVVFTEDRGPVRHVVMSRPEKRNAMNQELLRELGAALGAAADDDAVHCVVLRGEGRVFSAGIDLGEFAHPPTRAFRNMFLYFRRCVVVGVDVPDAVAIVLSSDAAGRLTSTSSCESPDSSGRRRR